MVEILVSHSWHDGAVQCLLRYTNNINRQTFTEGSPSFLFMAGSSHAQREALLFNTQLGGTSGQPCPTSSGRDDYIT